MMRKKTDMRGVREMALTLLYVDIVETSFSPVVVSHPFTETGIVGLHGNTGKTQMANILESENDLNLWRNEMRDFIQQAPTYLSILSRVTKPYKLTFMDFVEPHLSKEALSDGFHQEWTSIENISMDVNVSQQRLRELLGKCLPERLMDKAQLKVFNALPRCDNRL